MCFAPTKISSVTFVWEFSSAPSYAQCINGAWWSYPKKSVTTKSSGVNNAFNSLRVIVSPIAYLYNSYLKYATLIILLLFISVIISPVFIPALSAELFFEHQQP